MSEAEQRLKLDEDETQRIVIGSPSRQRDGTTMRMPHHAAPTRGLGRSTAPKVTLPARFGDWLVRRELISRQDLYSALHRSHQPANPCRVGDALVELGVLPRDEVEEEARSFRCFTTFTVSVAPTGPRRLDEVRSVTPLQDALTALTKPSR